MLLISLLLITGIYFLANLSLVVIWLKNPIDSSFLKENIFETLRTSILIYPIIEDVPKTSITKVLPI
jgi:hypothetical protein